MYEIRIFGIAMPTKNIDNAEIIKKTLPIFFLLNRLLHSAIPSTQLCQILSSHIWPTIGRKIWCALNKEPSTTPCTAQHYYQKINTMIRISKWNLVARNSKWISRKHQEISQNKGPNKGKGIFQKNTQHDNFQVCQTLWLSQSHH